jgi:hypothetical protein
MDRLRLDHGSSVAEAGALTQEWVDEHVPQSWRDAAGRGGARAIREVRSREEYEAWYPNLADGTRRPDVAGRRTAGST